MAVKGNLGASGCGVILHNKNGNMVKVMVVSLGSQTNHLAKVMGLYGLRIAVKCSYKWLWIEGDSLNILNCFKKGLKLCGQL